MDNALMEVRAKLFAKKQVVMLAMGKLPRKGVNTYQNYNYVRDEDVVDGFRQAFAEAGLSWTVDMVDRWLEPGNKTCVQLSIVFEDQETGWQTDPITTVGEAFDKGDKGTPKAQTSGLKYFLLKNFLVASGNEPDADSEPGEEDKKEQPKRTAPKRKPAPAKNLANGEQKTRIRELLVQVSGEEKPDVDAMLKKASFPAMAALTTEQADEAIKRLEAKVAEDE